jgi:uncharacterized protein (TIGR03086 family)
LDSIELYERAARPAAALARGVRDEQRSLPTPCEQWDVAALLEHMAGGVGYLLGSLGADAAAGVAAWPDEAAVAACVAALREPGALARRCMSPAGFEWSVGDAAAGTAMDQLVHTWDLASALDEPPGLDAEVAAAIVARFVPSMPEVGRQAGFVGPEVHVPVEASSVDRLLGAMGRDPRR